MDSEDQFDRDTRRIAKLVYWFLWTGLWLAVATTVLITCFGGAFLIKLLGSW